MGNQTQAAAVQPNIILQVSNDGGYSWGPGLPKTVGKAGERQARCAWYKLGSARDRVFRVTVTAPVKWVIIGASMRVEVEG